MAKKTTEYPMVRILWADSNLPVDGWRLVSDIADAELCKCISVGFLVNSTKEVKTLVQNLTLPLGVRTTQGAGVIDIPARAVLSIQKLTQ